MCVQYFSFSFSTVYSAFLCNPLSSLSREPFLTAVSTTDVHRFPQTKNKIQQLNEWVQQCVVQCYSVSCLNQQWATEVSDFLQTFPAEMQTEYFYTCTQVELSKDPPIWLDLPIMHIWFHGYCPETILLQYMYNTKQTVSTNVLLNYSSNAHAVTYSKSNKSCITFQPIHHALSALTNFDFRVLIILPISV